MLLTNRQRAYDLITIEITNIWFAGATNLYSREFYELARRRLKPEGVLQQWVQLHHVGSHEVACELATARAVFPYVGLWFYGGQGEMIASARPLVLEEARRPDLVRRFRSASLVDELYASALVSPSGLTRSSSRPSPRDQHGPQSVARILDAALPVEQLRLAAP